MICPTGMFENPLAIDVGADDDEALRLHDLGIADFDDVGVLDIIVVGLDAAASPAAWILFGDNEEND